MVLIIMVNSFIIFKSESNTIIDVYIRRMIIFLKISKDIMSVLFFSS